MRTSRPALLTVLTALTLSLAACGGGDDDVAAAPDGATEKERLTVAAAGFSENVLLAHMYAKVLEKAGYPTEVKELGNRELIEKALEAGDVDVVPEYVGTLTEFLNKKVNGPEAEAKASGDLDATVTALRELAAPLGITVLEPSEAADQNAFAVTEEFAAENRLETLSDLAGYRGPLVLGGPTECPTRPFCQPGLEKTYGLTITGFKALDAGGPLTKKALADGTIQLGLVFSSDGGIKASGLRVLTDDKDLQTVDNIVAAVNADAAAADVVEALDGVAAALTTDELIELNGKIDTERRKPEAVAEEWLESEGLL